MTAETKIMRMQRMYSCNEYFDKLAKRLEGSHTAVGSCNKEDSRYLVLKGTEGSVSYYGKPYCSFRVSGHWNWRASTRKCADPYYIQCFSHDIHYPFRRPAPGMASKPVLACCVGYFGLDRKYHVVYGEVYNPITRKVDWIERPIDDVVKDLADDLLVLKEEKDNWRKSA